MVENQKSVFWKAAIATLVIFIVGLLLGVYIESIRTEGIQDGYEDLELRWQDSKLRTDFYQLLGRDFCEYAIEENLEFSDAIYARGRQIELNEQANKFDEKLLKEKRKYALLKTEFFMNAILLKERCNADYHNVVYFYKDDPNSDFEKQEQKVQSGILGDLKEKYGRDIMLIPLPIDLDVSVIDIFVSTYNVKETPAVMIDESVVLHGLHSFEDIESFL
ncbi:MAG: hypothetical protein ABIH25_01950 [Candidatus Woesearchaeota archaeon]